MTVSRNKSLSFYYGKYHYDYLLIREDRKTLSLTVKPDMNIVLKAPVKANHKRIDSFLRRKWLWLETQLRYFGKYQRKTYRREYLSGETFLYLGRQYKLQVSRGKLDGVKLTRGVLCLTTTHLIADSKHNRLVLNGWFRKRTKIVFTRRFKIVFVNFEYQSAPELVIRRMPKRWGSFVNKSRIMLNPDLIRASTDCIDYVITHELCHINYKNHTPAFYKLLTLHQPNWRVIKDKLELKYS